LATLENRWPLLKGGSSGREVSVKNWGETFYKNRRKVGGGGKKRKSTLKFREAVSQRVFRPGIWVVNVMSLGGKILGLGRHYHLIVKIKRLKKRVRQVGWGV